MSTWREMITDVMEIYGESFADVVSSTITDEQLDVEFDSGFGSPEGIPFTIWTKNRVYFPHEYDGAESVRSVSRNPDGAPTSHYG